MLSQQTSYTGIEYYNLTDSFAFSWRQAGIWRSFVCPSSCLSNQAVRLCPRGSVANPRILCHNALPVRTRACTSSGRHVHVRGNAPTSFGLIPLIKINKLDRKNQCRDLSTAMICFMKTLVKVIRHGQNVPAGRGTQTRSGDLDGTGR